eukprot:CAMPEP_0169278262 /NCGR_PEP_ID=MMETSP1016-20121227/54210_1 /TAXON_ID=342587 /ORGANISM="Karlodinium micrum, Strain CCMP2283" /LENGTH=39 /DNA_ID= /DNA_START= /DNA_END= /DNA_ORIENTATION=
MITFRNDVIKAASRIFTFSFAFTPAAAPLATRAAWTAAA